jgi:hypothetical protein
MYESVERRAGWSQSEVVMYNKTNRLCLVIRLVCGVSWFVYTLRTFVCRSFTDLIIWRVRQCHECFYLTNIIFIIQYMFWSKFLIEWLGLTWLSVFSVGDYIRVWILLYYLFSRLIWDLSMSEGLSPLTISW